jgi:hypothetical protein
MTTGIAHLVHSSLLSNTPKELAFDINNNLFYRTDNIIRRIASNNNNDVTICVDLSLSTNNINTFVYDPKTNEIVFSIPEINTIQRLNLTTCQYRSIIQGPSSYLKTIVGDGNGILYATVQKESSDTTVRPLYVIDLNTKTSYSLPAIANQQDPIVSLRVRNGEIYLKSDQNSVIKYNPKTTIRTEVYTSIEHPRSLVFTSTGIGYMIASDPCIYRIDSLNGFTYTKWFCPTLPLYTTLGGELLLDSFQQNLYVIERYPGKVTFKKLEIISQNYTTVGVINGEPGISSIALSRNDATLWICGVTYGDNMGHLYSLNLTTNTVSNRDLPPNMYSQMTINRNANTMYISKSNASVNTIETLNLNDPAADFVKYASITISPYFLYWDHVDSRLMYWASDYVKWILPSIKVELSFTQIPSAYAVGMARYNNNYYLANDATGIRLYKFTTNLGSIPVFPVIYSLRGTLLDIDKVGNIYLSTSGYATKINATTGIHTYFPHWGNGYEYVDIHYSDRQNAMYMWQSSTISRIDLSNGFETRDIQPTGITIGYGIGINQPANTDGGWIGSISADLYKDTYRITIDQCWNDPCNTTIQTCQSYDNDNFYRCNCINPGLVGNNCNYCSPAINPCGSKYKCVNGTDAYECQLIVSSSSSSTASNIVSSSISSTANDVVISSSEMSSTNEIISSSDSSTANNNIMSSSDDESSSIVSIISDSSTASMASSAVVISSSINPAVSSSDNPVVSSSAVASSADVPSSSISSSAANPASSSIISSTIISSTNLVASSSLSASPSSSADVLSSSIGSSSAFISSTTNTRSSSSSTASSILSSSSSSTSAGASTGQANQGNSKFYTLANSIIFGILFIHICISLLSLN